MVISGETHTVELTYAGQNISVTETSTSFYNERQKVQVSLAKAIEKDKTFGIGDNGEIKISALVFMPQKILYLQAVQLFRLMD